MIALSIITALFILLSLANVLLTGALARKNAEFEASNKELIERIGVAERCITRMIELHAEQAKFIKDFADASPLLRQMNKIMKVEIEKREKQVQDALEAFKIHHPGVKPN